MTIKEYTTENFLSKYVSALIYHHDYYPDHKMDKYLPDGTINIIFELSGKSKFIFDNKTGKPVQECKDYWFSGVLKDYITISSEHEEMIVLVFKPGSGFPLIHQSVAPFTNKVVPADQVFGENIRLLLQALKKPTYPEEKFSAIEKWLVEQIIDDDFYTEIIRAAIASIQQSPSQIKISDLKAKSGYSEKQFIQIFKKYVGITPKQIHRIVRFNEILSAVEKEKKISWTQIASECGYFDQAHFIRDFKS
ncbi:MAG: AraC family transcriptional regulator, partial [Cyclobacteriaceae bacterium]